VLHVERVVVAVDVDAGDLDLVAGPGDVDVVAQQHHVLLPGHSPGRHAARALLDRDLLVVPVERALLVQHERALRLAARAHAQLHLLVVVHENGPFFLAAFVADVQHAL
jgi:hypothetical protein